MDKSGFSYKVSSILLALGLILLLVESGDIFSEEVPQDDSAVCRECHILGRKPRGFLQNKIPEQMRKSPAELKKLPRHEFWSKTKHSQAGNICTNCHDPYTLKEPKFLIESKEKLCLGCHTIQREELQLGHYHHPAKLGQCILCHSPHGTALEHQMRHEVNLVCEMCHTGHKELLAQDYPHRAVVENKCVLCHAPHGSTVEKRLKKVSDDLCLDCHKETKKDLQRAQVHQPLLTGQCISCHNPHGGDNRYRLLAKGRDLCLRCHWEKTKEFTKVHQHSGAELKDDCLTCHTAHCADFKGMLISEKSKLCSSCHQEVLAQFAELYHHPIEADEKIVSCTSCHNPHGTEEGRRLLKEGNNLCFSCHPEIESSYLNSAHDDDDILCTACHQPHGSSNEKHLILDKSKLCYLCHETIKTEFEKAVHHPIISSPGYLNCTNCHNPHLDTATQKIVDPDNTSTLYGALDSAFCLKCHDASPPSSVGGSPVNKSTYTSSAHYTAGSKNCDDCHQHHGSDNTNMLISSETAEAFCYSTSDNSCHGTGDTGNDVQTDFAKTSHHPVENSGDIECSNCHNVHLDTATQKIVDPDNTSTLYGTLDSAFCLRCHDGDPPSSVGGSPIDRTSYLSSDHYNQGYNCLECHSQHGTNNAHLLVKTKADLCDDCHVSETGDPHLAVTARACVSSGCHDGSSGATDRSDFATASGPQHYLGGTVDSTSYSEGEIECATCHESDPRHSGTPPYTLKSEEAICYDCHDAVEAEFDKASHHDVENSGDVECTNCHNPHLNTDDDKIVNPDDTSSLYGALDSNFCLKCHDGSKPASVGGSPANQSSYTSSAHKVTALKDCDDCHHYHGTANANMLISSATEETYCYTADSDCHGTGDTADVQTDFAKSTKHPVATDKVECTNCHNPHISTDAAPLVDPNNTSTSYGAVDDAFCFRCHDGDPPESVNGNPLNIWAEYQAQDTIVTEWVLSGKNKHFSHQGYATCVYCHEYHGSNGSSGVNRGATLKDWLRIVDDPYKNKNSCVTTDPGSKCH